MRGARSAMSISSASPRSMRPGNRASASRPRKSAGTPNAAASVEEPDARDTTTLVRRSRAGRGSSDASSTMTLGRAGRAGPGIRRPGRRSRPDDGGSTSARSSGPPRSGAQGPPTPPAVRRSAAGRPGSRARRRRRRRWPRTAGPNGARHLVVQMGGELGMAAVHGRVPGRGPGRDPAPPPRGSRSRTRPAGSNSPAAAGRASDRPGARRPCGQCWRSTHSRPSRRQARAKAWPRPA